MRYLYMGGLDKLGKLSTDFNNVKNHAIHIRNLKKCYGETTNIQ
jgi:hypothetical protein